MIAKILILKERFISTHRQQVEIVNKLESNEYPLSEFRKLYTKTTGSPLEIGDRSQVYLNLFIDSHRKFFEKLQFRRLPYVNSIWIKSIENGDVASVNKFISYSLPKGWSVSFNGGYANEAEAKHYVDSIWKTAPRLGSLSIDNLSLTNKEFERIVYSSSHMRYLCFVSWILMTDDEWDFSSIISTNLENLTFTATGAFNRSKWSTNIKRFENIIKGIRKNEVMSTKIREISIFNCGITKDIGTKILEKYSLSHIVLWQVV